jgi:hypothetical protein
VVLGGEPQVGGQARGVGGQALHRRRVGGTVPGSHLADPASMISVRGPGGVSEHAADGRAEGERTVVFGCAGMCGTPRQRRAGTMSMPRARSRAAGTSSTRPCPCRCLTRRVSGEDSLIDWGRVHRRWRRVRAIFARGCDLRPARPWRGLFCHQLRPDHRYRAPIANTRTPTRRRIRASGSLDWIRAPVYAPARPPMPSAMPVGQSGATGRAGEWTGP